MNYLNSVKVSGILFLLFFAFSAFGQTMIVQGTVRNMAYKALPGVTVKVKGAASGTTTDADGKYLLEVSPKAKLQFTCKQYESQVVKVKGMAVIDVILVKSTKEPDPDVNIGYGTVKKSNLTQSVSSVDESAIDQTSPNDVLQLFERVAGLEVYRSGSGVELRIRGVHTFYGSNEPLIILDGAPYTGAITELNKNDIKSIDVLKDASATSIYGSRGANGVILITSKSRK